MKKCFVLFIFFLFSVSAGAQSFTLEQVMSAPFPSGLTASPAGGKVAWILNEHGARNVWVAESPDYKGRRLTNYTEDDGQDLAELAWLPNGQGVVYTRGGDLETGRESFPNPRSNPEGVKQAIFVVMLDGKEPRQLADGHAPAISPKSDMVAYIAQGRVFTTKIDGSQKTSIISLRGPNGLRWSPDGTKLAFVSGRGNHGFIGVYDFASKSVRYLDPSVDIDSEPVWSKDGKQIAFIRIPAERDSFAFGPRRAAVPWSIHIADVDTGEGRELWKANQGKGSVFRGIVSDDQLFWTSDNRIVFPWEGDGWTHLYSIQAAGTAAATMLLTPGEFEVEHVSLSSNGKELIYSSNQGDIDRRHIWRVMTSGGSAKPVAVTSGTGLEWSPVDASDGKAIAFLRSGTKQPASAAIIIDGGAAKDLAPDTIPKDFPSASLVEPQQVIFNAVDGMKIHGQIFMPPNMQSGKRYPALLFFHGGSRRQMLLGWHYMDYYNNAYAMNQYLASKGYIVLSVNYRSGIGYGMEFREALNYGATGASEFNDVKGAGLYLKGRSDVDPQRIGLWGGSYGGYLTALGLARASDLFAAGVDFHGVHDWNNVVRNFVPTYDPQARPDAARLAFDSSPLASIKTWRSPVLLIHGDDDRNVPFGETVILAEALRKQNVEFEQLIFPDEIHGFLVHEHWITAYKAATDFFDKHLKK